MGALDERGHAGLRRARVRQLFPLTIAVGAITGGSETGFRAYWLLIWLWVRLESAENLCTVRLDLFTTIFLAEDDILTPKREGGQRILYCGHLAVKTLGEK